MIEMRQSLPTSQTTQPRIIAGIPAFNEQRFIREVILRVSKYVDEVIVVDDGSTDETSKVAKEAGALVIRHESRKGAGEATKSLFKAAKQNGAHILVTLDGDGQHNPDEIPQILALIVNKKADLVIGSRFLNSCRGMPKYRRFGIQVINWLYNIGAKPKISDTQCCFRAYGKKALNTLKIIYPSWGFSVQVLSDARLKGLNVKEVPISCVYHSASHSANPMSHGLCLVLTVVKLRLLNGLRRLNHMKFPGKTVN
jgi:glycosyltransferase involved in cell wall biosynthesis